MPRVRPPFSFAGDLMGLGVGTRVGVTLLVILAVGFARDWRQLAVNGALLGALALGMGIGRPLARRLGPFAPVILAMLLIHGLFNPANAHFVGVFGVEGLTYGGTVALRLVCLLAAANALLLTTPATELIRWCGSLHADLGTMLALVASVLPAMRKQMYTTLEAQEARGLRRDRRPDRLRAYIAVLVPVTVKSLIRAQARAQLLYLRGYDGRAGRRRRRPTFREGAMLAAGLVYLAINLAVAYLL